MENLTHSLVGTALAELALPATATPPQRRLFFAGGIIASNLPDADLLYTRITPPPLGYLLHHRGHTHTLVGVAAQALLIAIVCLTPGIRRLVAQSPMRFWVLIAVGLLGHVLLDSWNNYGVHPFYPFDSRWYYGDSIFIFEPWIWLPLGIAAAANARSRYVRLVVAGLTAGLPLVAAWLAMIPLGAVFAIAAVGIPLAWVASSRPPRVRSGAALAGVALFVAGMFGLSAVAKGKARVALRPVVHGEILDIVINPNPANPMCWNAIAIEKNERGGEYVMRRGTVSFSRATCGGATVWLSEVRQPLAQLRDLASEDCWVRAWLQFGRAPVIADGRISDLRFGGFTDMRLESRSHATTCPPHITHWAMPRADLLTPLP